jgi:hypothetical protein
MISFVKEFFNQKEFYIDISLLNLIYTSFVVAKEVNEQHLKSKLIEDEES